MNVSDIREKMEVVGSCGNHVGVVDAVAGASIRLKRSGLDDRRHYVALGWVESVGQTVRPSKTHDEAIGEWKAQPVWAGGG
jgi:hypothetical protein